MARSQFHGCAQHTQTLNIPAGSRLVKQNVRLPARAGGGVGHVYHHQATNRWYTVGATRQRGVYNVCTYVGTTCPCGG